MQGEEIFTNGHAKHRITAFYNHLEAMEWLDWTTIYSRYWSKANDDLDSQRRKAAEFLVKDHVPVACISSIYVYDRSSQEVVQALVDQLRLNSRVVIDNERKLYYS